MAMAMRSVQDKRKRTKGETQQGKDEGAQTTKEKKQGNRNTVTKDKGNEKETGS
jgi:hypothetical protein